MSENSTYNAFPSLQAKEIELERKVEKIKNQISEVKKHPRYADNESERTYQIEQLEEQLEQTLAAAEEDFQVELEALELHLAEQAFQLPDVDAEEAEQAERLANTIKAQLMTAQNKADTVELLETRIKTMSDAEKQAVKMALAGVNIDGLDEIMPALNDTAHMRDIVEQQAALKHIKQYANSLRRKYDTREKAVKEALSSPSPFSGDIDREFYEKYLKRGRK